jgi:hypothetical protein
MLDPMAILGVIAKQHNENQAMVAYMRALEKKLKDNNIPAPTQEEIAAELQGGQN